MAFARFISPPGPHQTLSPTFSTTPSIGPPQASWLPPDLHAHRHSEGQQSTAPNDKRWYSPRLCRCGKCALGRAIRWGTPTRSK